MSLSVACFLYGLFVICFAASKTSLGRKYFRLLRDFAALPLAAAVILLAALGFIFSMC